MDIKEAMPNKEQVEEYFDKIKDLILGHFDTLGKDTAIFSGVLAVIGILAASCETKEIFKAALDKCIYLSNKATDSMFEMRDEL